MNTKFEVENGQAFLSVCDHFLRMVKMRYRWVGKPEIGETKLCKLIGHAIGAN